ncbi:hypothetical protein F5B20DRAFT_560906 [Whalleya microplaca]|nr:hypothetical protein F5B20DRAFT_560906 [Whalleya microplaca]
MAETEKSKRLQSSLKTTKGDFSEIAAVSQRGINKAMANMLKQHDEMTHVSATLTGVSTLSAEIGQSQISLKVTGPSREDAEYFVTFSSGTLQFLVGDHRDPIDVSKWTIAFDVKISKMDIEEGSDEDKRVRAALNQPGDFSISSLFLEFNESKIMSFNFADSDFQGYDLDPDQRIYLGGVLAHWYVGSEASVMQDREKRTIAYGLKTKNQESVNELAPSFPPTALKFQTYEYIAPGKTKPEEGLGKGDSNMLLYLQMTDHASFPDVSIIEYSGNYASHDMDGTMCIGRSILWDKYLLRGFTPPSTQPLLQIFNQYTYAWVAKASASDPVITVNWEIGMGDPSRHSNNSEFYSWKQNPNDSMEWTWAPDDSEQRFKHQWQDDGAYANVDITCSTENKLKTQAGSNVVNASGITDIKIKSDAGGKIIGALWEYRYALHVWVNWSTEITISAVEDGGLAISLDLPDDLTKAFHVESDEPTYSSSNGGFGSLDFVKGLVQDLKNSITDTINKTNFGEKESMLQNDLRSSSRFVIPGGGKFLYKSPVFNDIGDLMIEASYKENI